MPPQTVIAIPQALHWGRSDWMASEACEASAGPYVVLSKPSRELRSCDETLAFRPLTPALLRPGVQRGPPGPPSPRSECAQLVRVSAVAERRAESSEQQAGATGPTKGHTRAIASATPWYGHALAVISGVGVTVTPSLGARQAMGLAQGHEVKGSTPGARRHPIRCRVPRVSIVPVLPRMQLAPPLVGKYLRKLRIVFRKNEGQVPISSTVYLFLF